MWQKEECSDENGKIGGFAFPDEPKTRYGEAQNKQRYDSKDDLVFRNSTKADGYTEPNGIAHPTLFEETQAEQKRRRAKGDQDRVVVDLDRVKS